MQTETTAQLWPLKSGASNKPALTPGTQTTFTFQDVPDRPPSGPLAYYLPGVLLTFQGAIVQSGSTGTAVYSDQFFGALFSNLGWVQAWHGTPVRTNDNNGAHWAVIEYFANGYRYASNPRQLQALGANGTYPFEVTLFVPFSSDRRISTEGETSQLALLARASQLQINVAAANVISSISTGATITGSNGTGSMTATASAILVPRAELILGTPIETILTQTVAGSGNVVTIQNFGIDSGLTGVDPGGGVLDLLFLTSALSQGGSFAAANITDFTWQWRGQNYTTDILGLLSIWKRQLPAPFAGETVGNLGGGLVGNSQLVGIPYAVANTALYGGTTGSTPVNVDLSNLLFWPLVLGGSRVRLSSLQTASSDQSFNLTAGSYSGTNKILGRYARSWQKQMRDMWVGQVMAGGDGSLAANVLGAGYGSAKLRQRGAAGKPYTTNDETRYLPWQLLPAAVAR
jgi:hypothetical protein